MGCTHNVVPNAMEELRPGDTTAAACPRAKPNTALRPASSSTASRALSIKSVLSAPVPLSRRLAAPQRLPRMLVRGADHRSGDLARGLRRRPADYNRPAAPIPGLVSFTAFDYDALGRDRRNKLRWVFPGPPTSTRSRRTHMTSRRAESPSPTKKLRPLVCGHPRWSWSHQAPIVAM
jgi:hypothetical protein